MVINYFCHKFIRVGRGWIGFKYGRIFFIDVSPKALDFNYALFVQYFSNQEPITSDGLLLKLINNSSSLNKGNHDRDGVWISNLN